MDTFEKLKQEMQRGIDDVFTHKEESFESNGICPNMVKEYLEGMNWKQVGDLETNGWDYDWWLTFEKGKEKFVASGSGYYGTFKFERDDEISQF